METKRKIESIFVVLGKALPDEIRIDKNIPEDHFVEIRVERENPVVVNLIDMGKESPGRKFSRLLKENNTGIIQENR